MNILGKVMKEIEFFYLDMCYAAFTPIWKTVPLFNYIVIKQQLKTSAFLH